MLWVISLVLLLIAVVKCDLNPATIKGYKFFDASTGESLALRGIDYYPRPNAGANNRNNLDFFSDEHRHVWERDIEELKALNVNAIRIYAVDTSKNHDRFMCALSAANIYVIVGLAASCTDCAVTGEAAPTCYQPGLKKRGQEIIHHFAKYSNVLGFSAGNEVNHVVSNPETNAPCLKKFLRDMRAYVAGCSKMRQIPIGVVIADSNRDANTLYYNCRSDASDTLENAEWFGINVYQHCDGQATDINNLPGFNALRNDFQRYKYSIPAMLTEYGCLNPSFPTVDGYAAQRSFLQAKTLFEPPFREQFAGGFVFEYSTELINSESTSDYPFTAFGPQNYGVGYLSPKTCNDIDVNCTFIRMPNFDSLSEAYGSVSITGEATMENFTPDAARTSPTTCPSQFPALSTFTWASDAEPYIVCPNRVAWSCTGQNSDALPNEYPDIKGTSGPNGDSASDNPGDGSQNSDDASKNDGDASKKSDSAAASMVPTYLLSILAMLLCMQ